MLDQHRLRPAHQQRPRHRQAIEQRLRLAPEKLSSSSWFGHMKSATAAASSSRKSLTSAGTLQPFSGWPITGSHRYSALGFIDLIRATPAENRPTLRRTAQITRQHRIAIAQLANRRDAFDQFGNLVWRQHVTGPLAVLGVVGELHRVERPDIHPDPLHRKNRGTVAGVTKHHVGLDSEQMGRTFHAVSFRKTIEIQAAQYATKRSLYDRPATQLS
jgi:hypothetical protein